MNLQPGLSSLDEAMELLARGQSLRYAGEPVTQWEHAMQTAALALQAGASDALVAASLLHDLGHLAQAGDDSPTLAGLDDRHEALAARWLSPLFGEDVTEPIRLHVEAKRWLVANTPGYAQRLSEDSLRSLALQGGAMTHAESAAFRALPHAADALRLRVWDDLAKDAGMPAQRIERFMPTLLAALNRR